MTAMQKDFPISIQNLTMAYDGHVIQRNLTFDVERGSIFIVMGDSGCGKSTLLRHITGQMRPYSGQILRDGIDIWDCSPSQLEDIQRSSGLLYQSGALWSGMTLEENVALPLQQFTTYGKSQIHDICMYKLALVGLAGTEGLYPSQISGGLRKRAGLARAMALDPRVLFFDEPSAGLDPLSARRLDELILQLRETLNATFVVITHELESIFMIGTDSVFLDSETHTMLGKGAPLDLKEHSPHYKIRSFLRRGEI